jgi:uncharacterized protein HemY
MFALLGFPDAITGVLAKYRHTTDPDRANQIAWCCALAPSTITNFEDVVKLAEVAVNWVRLPHQRADALITLGAVLYRAGRHEEAIRRLEEGLGARSGSGGPHVYAFLAMAHHKLGHRDEALRWLNLDGWRHYVPSTDLILFWHELESRRLLSEAEAVVLYDPMFPADPFGN